MCSKAKSIASLFTLAYLCTYLVMGNVPRFFSLSETGNTLPVTEVGLYIVGIIIMVSRATRYRVILRRYLPIGLIITGSFIYGFALNGFNLKALLFNVRLQLQILTAAGIGCILYDVYGVNIIRAIRFYINIYLAVVVLGLGIFMLFPDSREFYAFLQSVGINYIGDPHIYRFISPYLDPNLFAAIIIFPIFASFVLYWRTWNLWYLLGCVFFILALMLSVSRSGVGALAISIAIFIIWTVYRIIKKGGIPRRLLVKLSVSIAIFMLSMLVFGPMVVERLADRFFQSISEEGSALLRYESFTIGLDLMSKYPLFGVGYNYGVLAAEERTLVSVHEGVQVGFDSSLQTLLVNFGAIPTIVLFWWLVSWYRKAYVRLNAMSTYAKDHKFILKLLFFYILMCLFFAGQFNNVIFYQFWLIPVVVLSTYLSRCAGLLQVQR